MGNAIVYRTRSGYSVLDELTDTQVNMLVFLAGRSDQPPRGFVPATIQALKWRGLIHRVQEDSNRWHATEVGRRAVDALPNDTESGPAYSSEDEAMSVGGQS